MKKGWNFPDNNNGQIVGISEAGIETFKGNPIESLTREICQNSLDARKKDNMPVKVEFNLNILKTSEIEGFDELKNALYLCKEFWTENKNEKTIRFFEKSYNAAKCEYINVLRISDYNTTGLTGSRGKYNTPWQNLVKSSGVSDKSGSSGGSFGIGKAAPFVCSAFRTVIYSTLDIDGIQASQGVARLVSFENKSGVRKKYITQGVGYYGNTEDNSAIDMMINMGKYKRTETGTDLYILGFSYESDWIDEIIKAVLDGFLISVINNNLIVKVDKYEVNAETLSDYIEKYKIQCELAFNYYKVLTSENTVTVTEDFKGLGNVSLRVLLDSEFKRKVLVTRKNGMKIFDKDRISGNISFAGILDLEGKKVNEYFREMETPQHDNWEPGRHSAPREAQRYKTELFKWVKENIIEIGRETTTDEIDAEGVGDYIPDELFIESNNSDNKVEALENQINNIEITEVKSVNVKKGTQNLEDTGIKGDIEVPGFYDDESTDGKTYIPGEGMNNSDGGIGMAVSGKEAAGGDKTILKTVSIKPMYVRMFMSDYEKNQYTLKFTPEKSAEQTYVKLSVAGEQANIKIPIKSAHLTNMPDISLKIKDNKILIGKVVGKSSISIDFTINYEDICSMEVNLYGIKV